MSAVELNEPFLAKIAGWEVMKKARALLEQGTVLSSNWTPPLLKGVVQEGSISYRAGLVIKDTINLENICRCRSSQDWGTICVHSVAVGLHHLRRNQEPVSPPKSTPSSAPTQPGSSASPSAGLRKPGKRLRRAVEIENAELIEISAILPPNLEAALARGKVMLCLEAKWSRGRTPLNALPLNIPFRFSAEDVALLNCVEELAEGDTPGMLMLSNEHLAALLSRIAGHPRVTIGRSRPLDVSAAPWRVPLLATLEDSGEISVASGDEVEELV